MYPGSAKCFRYQGSDSNVDCLPESQTLMSLFYLQCSVERQNCDSSWPRATSQQTAFTNTSCVRDARIPGDVGRCGWQGAPCQVNGTVSNCASPNAEICRNGFCAGGVGQPCIPIGGRYTCNAPVYCNVTVGLGPGAICGGEGATVNVDDANKGLNFARDYCLSGIATQNGSQYWLCAAGPDPVATTSGDRSPASSTNANFPSSLPVSNSRKTKSTLIGPIAGAAIGALLLGLMLLFCWYRRRSQNRQKYRVDAWKDIDSKEPAPLLHRRGLSEESTMSTRTSHSTNSHVTPFVAERSSGVIRSTSMSGPEKMAIMQERINAAAVSPSTETSESSDMLSQDSHLTTPLPVRKKSTGHTSPQSIGTSFRGGTLPRDGQIIPPVPPIPRRVPVPALLPAVTFVTSPTRSRTRPASRNASTSTLGHARLDSTSIPPLPDSPPVSSEDVEQRLLELRNEADRGLAEIRAQRSLSLVDEVPPPYHLP